MLTRNQQSAAETFLTSGSGGIGRPFHKAGRAGSPFLEIETHDLRKSQTIQDLCDLMKYLKEENQLNAQLNPFKGDTNVRLQNTLRHKVKHTADRDMGFWRMVKSDIPWPLSEGIYLDRNDPHSNIRKVPLKADQFISNHPFFHGVHIARNSLCAFHRDDGICSNYSSF